MAMMLPFAKKQHYRNPKLTAFARGRDCTMHSPWCNGNPETSVWCHSNELRHGKGKGVKAHDLFGFIGCSGCNSWYDDGPAPREEKQEAFWRAWEASLILACEAGVLVTGRG